ncbi:MAG: flagellar hook-basal body complex protein [Clostridia bacterium]|nr:flagellar hook-basal body complex protein [Clostridia bacterium]MDR3643532.1 flagellar hook-basal body complex protein [Clostridia bacterium]
MLRAMSSAVSGLQAQQTELDVIGNNIANVNTTGFQSSRVLFKDMFYSMVNSGSSEQNPSQVGNGTQVGSIDKLMTREGATQTDRALDLYIDGDGYFAVNSQSDGSGGTDYTRVGDFHVDSKGYLVDTNGKYVEGADSSSGTTTLGQGINLESGNSLVTLVTSTGSIIPIDSGNYSQLTNIAINSDGTISASMGDQTGTLNTAKINSVGGNTGFSYGDLSDITYDPTTSTYTATDNGTAGTALDVGASGAIKIGIVNFANPDGLAEDGDSNFTATLSSGSANCINEGTSSGVLIRSGELEMSNVDLAKEFTNMITTERGYQSNARVITTSDEMVQELVNLKRS